MQESYTDDVPAESGPLGRTGWSIRLATPRTDLRHGNTGGDPAGFRLTDGRIEGDTVTQR